MYGKSWRSCELRIDGGPLLKLGWGRHPLEGLIRERTRSFRRVTGRMKKANRLTGQG